MTITGRLKSFLADGIPVVAILNGEGDEVDENSRSDQIFAACDHAGLAAAVLKLAEMTYEERDAMCCSRLDVNLLEFDRDTLIVRFEDWLGQLKAEVLSPCVSRDAQ